MQKLIKMKYKLFIGIDISKKTIDVAIKAMGSKELPHKQFENNRKGFIGMIKWVKKETKAREDEMFFLHGTHRYLHFNYFLLFVGKEDSLQA